MGMKLNAESIEYLNASASEKGIDLETLLSKLADAIEAGYKEQADSDENTWVTIDPVQMEIRVMSVSEGEEGSEEVDITPQDFGRIAIQAIRQFLTQGIREVEWDQRYEEYAGREGEVVTGIVKQNDPRFTLLDLGSVEALLPSSEQVPYERPEAGTRLKAYIVEVRHTSKGPQVVVSRTHPGLIHRLFEVEVPEIADGIVQILACSREPGHRTKISVYSNDESIDPIGACVGAGGVRVRPIVNELNGEKIDIVPYDENPAEYVRSALSPAKVKEVEIIEEENEARVIVPDQQLSLAIGREGQNARLAARLTGYLIKVEPDGDGEQHTEETPADKKAQSTKESDTQDKDGKDESTDDTENADDTETKDIEGESQEGEQEWASGEWVADEETGEQMFHPADGSDPISLAEWEKLTENESTQEAKGDEAADESQDEAAEKAKEEAKDEESKDEAADDEKSDEKSNEEDSNNVTAQDN